MVRALMIILILALRFVAVGQDVVKVNILEIAGNIPPPPKDVKDAFSRTAEHQEEGGTAAQRDADAFFRPVAERLGTTDQQIQKAVEVLSKPQMDAAKEMDQKEMQKKFKSMSQEEQMKMAMEMSKKMGMTGMVPEPEPVMAATQECSKINEAIGKDMQTAQEGYMRREQLSLDRDKKHSEIEAWKDAEERKLPQISTGEMGGPEPKAEHALLTKAMQKHLEVENDYLKEVQKEWKAGWEKYRGRFAPLQEKLAKINYGADAKNPTTKRQLLNGQGQMLASTKDLVDLSRKATKGGAEWWERKLELEKNKPKD